MPDFLTTLAQRTLKAVPVIQPMIAPLYAASFTEAAAPMEQEIWTEPAHTLKQAKPGHTPHKLHNSHVTVPPAAVHTEEVPLNRVEASPNLRHDDRFFRKSEGENAAQKPTSESPTPLLASPYPYFDDRRYEPPVSALDQGARKVPPLPNSPHIQESLETNTHNDIYPEDYRNSTTDVPSREKDVEGTNALPEQFELVQRTGMAISAVLRSPETSGSSLLIGEPHKSVPLYTPGSSETSSQIKILPPTHEQHGIINLTPTPDLSLPGNEGHRQHGIINLTPTPDISLPGNGVHRQHGIINLTPTPDISLPGNGVHRQHGIINIAPTPDLSLPGNGNGVLNNNVASLLDVSSDGRRLNDDPTLFSTRIAPFHPPQSTNTSGPQGFDAASDEPIRSHTPPAPVVHITIGRIDVRAITTQAPETRRSTGKTRSSLSLDDYMNKQSKGER